jgi:hypothetical protein
VRSIIVVVVVVVVISWSQWPRSLKQVLSSAARTLGSQVRILLGAWMCVRVFSVLCCPV